jgi:hypothetical protein
LFYYYFFIAFIFKTYINEDNIININEKEEKNFDNNLNSNNKFISQNFFDKNKDNNKKINLSNKKLEKGEKKKNLFKYYRRR